MNKGQVITTAGMLALLLGSGLFVIALNKQPGDPGSIGVLKPANYCDTSADCVPKVCCHARAYINRQVAPDCSQTLCSMECRPGTLDCGNGSRPA